MAVETAIPLSQKATQLFAERGIENPRLEAELLLAHVLGIKRLDLYLQFDRPLTAAQLEQFRACVRRRLKREPLQYITGRVQFRELELHVDARALIPRPETELLAGEVIRYARARAEPLRAVDLGTGTGALALSLARECPGLSVLATDVSADAIALAQQNGSDNGIAIEYAVGSLWEAVPAGARFDIVVSNPPYVAEHERAELAAEVRDHEPGAALFAGPEGLDVLARLIAGAPAHMNDAALLALEIGMTQGERVQDMLRATSSFEDIRVLRDLSERERMVTAIRRK